MVSSGCPPGRAFLLCSPGPFRSVGPASALPGPQLPFHPQAGLCLDLRGWSPVGPSAWPWFHLPPFPRGRLDSLSSLSVFLKWALLRCWHSGLAVLSCCSLPSFHPVFTTTFSLRLSVARSVAVGFPDPGWRLLPHWGPCPHDVLGPFFFLFVCCAMFMGCHLC